MYTPRDDGWHRLCLINTDRSHHGSRAHDGTEKTLQIQDSRHNKTHHNPDDLYIFLLGK